jgi:hypothetical protein
MWPLLLLLVTNWQLRVGVILSMTKDTTVELS